MTKTYANKLDGEAAAFIQGWDQTKHNQYKSDLFSSITMVVDLLTAFGVGGSAVTQFASKEFAEVNKTFDKMTAAYWQRPAQVGDLVQAAGNAGYNLKNYQSNTGAGVVAEAPAQRR